MAKLILRQYDYSIHKANNSDGFVTPFTLDMALLYEHYVYGLLNKAYGRKITYQFKGETGYPDFLFRTDDFKAILDTKYIPKYEICQEFFDKTEWELKTWRKHNAH